MADVIGRTNSLPGALHPVPQGTMCDSHEDRPAYKRVQGETDSMGAELIDMCSECHTEYTEARQNADHSGYCDWCKTTQPRVRPRRDFEEGMSGPVYDVCDACIARETESLMADDEDAGRDSRDDEPFYTDFDDVDDGDE